MSYQGAITSSRTFDEKIEKGRAVKFDGGDAVNVEANDDGVRGVAVNTVKSGRLGAIVRSGPAEMQCADGDIEDGDKVAIDADGRAVADSGGGETVVGEALEDGEAPSGGKYAYIRVNLDVIKD